MDQYCSTFNQEHRLKSRSESVNKEHLNAEDGRQDLLYNYCTGYRVTPTGV